MQILLLTGKADVCSFRDPKHCRRNTSVTSTPTGHSSLMHSFNEYLSPTVCLALYKVLRPQSTLSAWFAAVFSLGH